MGGYVPTEPITPHVGGTPPGGSVLGAPYTGPGSTNLNNPGAIQGDWGGTSTFWNNPQAVFSWQNQMSSYLGQPASSTQYNPYTEGSAAYDSYESIRRSNNMSPTATAQNQPTYNEYITSRPGFYTDVGDSQTDIIMQQQGVSELEALRQQVELAADTPGLTDDRFYQNELSKANHNLVEASSGYHAWGMDTGLPVAPNPFEYVGDLALALEKGTNGPSSAYGVSPVDLNILGLPGGQGIQDAQYNMAVAYDKNQPIPAFPDFTQAISTIDKARNTGEMGPYANLGSPTWQQWNPETQSYSTEKIPLSDQQAIGYYASGGNPELLYSDPANMKNAVALGFGMNYNTPEKTVVNVPGLTVEKGTGDIDTFGYQKPFLSSPNGAAASTPTPEPTPETNIELPTLSPTFGFGAQAADVGNSEVTMGGAPIPGATSPGFDPIGAIGGFFGGLFGGNKETPIPSTTTKESPFYTSKAAYGANLTQYNTDVNALNADVLAYKTNPAYNKYTADLALFNADVKAYEKAPTQAGYDNLVSREAGLKSTGAVFDAQYNSLNQRSTALDTRKGQLDSEFAKTESYRAGVEYKTPVGDGTYNSLTFTIKPDWKEFTSTSPPPPEKNIIDTSLDWVGGNIRAVGEVPIIGNIVDMGVAAKPVVGFVPVFGQAVKVPLELASRPGAQTQPDDMNGPRPYGEFSAWGGGAGNWLEQQGLAGAETSKVRVDISREKMMSPDLSIPDRVFAGYQLFRSGGEGIVRQYPEEILTAGEQMYLAGPAFGLAAEGTAGGGTWLATKLGASPSVVNLATKAGEYVIPAGFVGLMAGEVTKDEKGNMFSDFSAPNIVLKSGEMSPYLFSMMVGASAFGGFGKSGEKTVSTENVRTTSPIDVGFETTPRNYALTSKLGEGEINLQQFNKWSGLKTTEPPKINVPTESNIRLLGEYGVETKPTVGKYGDSIPSAEVALERFQKKYDSMYTITESDIAMMPKPTSSEMTSMRVLSERPEPNLHGHLPSRNTGYQRNVIEFQKQQKFRSRSHSSSDPTMSQVQSFTQPSDPFSGFERVYGDSTVKYKMVDPVAESAKRALVVEAPQIRDSLGQSVKKWDTRDKARGNVDSMDKYYWGQEGIKNKYELRGTFEKAREEDYRKSGLVGIEKTPLHQYWTLEKVTNKRGVEIERWVKHNTKASPIGGEGGTGGTRSYADKSSGDRNTFDVRVGGSSLIADQSTVTPISLSDSLGMTASARRQLLRQRAYEDAEPVYIRRDVPGMERPQTQNEIGEQSLMNVNKNAVMEQSEQNSNLKSTEKQDSRLTQEQRGLQIAMQRSKQQSEVISVPLSQLNVLTSFEISQLSEQNKAQELKEQQESTPSYIITPIEKQIVKPIQKPEQKIEKMNIFTQISQPIQNMDSVQMFEQPTKLKQEVTQKPEQMQLIEPRSIFEQMSIPIQEVTQKPIQKQVTEPIPTINPIIKPVIPPYIPPVWPPEPPTPPKPPKPQTPGKPGKPPVIGGIPYFPSLRGGGTEPGHRIGKSQFTEYLGYVMIGKKKVKMQAPQQKVVTRIVRVPTRQHQIYGLAAPTLPPMTQAQAPSNSQAQIVKVAMKKGFAAPNITAKPIRPARLAQPKLTRPTADPFKVRRRR